MSFKDESQAASRRSHQAGQISYRMQNLGETEQQARQHLGISSPDQYIRTSDYIVPTQSTTGFGGIPYPEYQSAFGKPSAMDDKGRYVDPMLATNQYNNAYLNKYVDFANSTTASPWLQAMQSSINTQGALQSSNAAKQAQNAMAAAREQLALRRGLSSGAGERLAVQGNLQDMLARQQVAADTSNKLAQAGITEYGQKQSALSALPGMELQRAANAQGVQQTNITNLLQEQARKNNYELEKYKAQMQAWGAQKTGEAYANAGQQESSWWNPLSW